MEGQNKEGSSVGKKQSTSWWPFGGKKPDTDEENNALSSTPSKIGKIKFQFKIFPLEGYDLQRLNIKFFQGRLFKVN